MASLALGLAGAAVGSFFGPLGAAVGWGLGAALGGSLFAKGQSGPRLTDLRAQNSAYGQPIPIGYGTIRIAGNVIWAADLVEHKTKSGGKGGPKVTTYSYTQSFAIGLLETSFIDGAGTLVNNPIVGILRVWADGRLIYGEGTEGTSLPMTIYYGTEDQEADPTIEADKGAGNVPAHRGQAYVVFADMDLGGFGNRIPNLTFEVVASGAIAMSYYAKWAVDYDYPIDGTTYSHPYLLNGVEHTSEGLVLHRYRSGADYGTEMGAADDHVVYYDRIVCDLKGNVLSTDPRVALEFPAGIQNCYGSLNSDVAYVEFQRVLDCSNEVDGVPGTTINTFAWLRGGGLAHTPKGGDIPALCRAAIIDPPVDYWDAHYPEIGTTWGVQTAPVSWNGFVYTAGKVPGTDMRIRQWSAASGSVHSDTPNEHVSFNADAVRTGYPSSNCVADAGDIMVGDDGYLYWLVSYSAGVTDGTRLFKLDAQLNLIDSWWTGDGANLPTPGYGSSGIYRGAIIGYHSGGVVLSGVPCYTMQHLNSDGTTTFVTEVQVDGTAIGGVEVSPVHYIGGGRAAVRDGIINLGSTGILLSDIVANVSAHVGFDSAEYNVDQLTDEVRGYAVTSRMTGRAAIEALQPAYQFGAVESNLQAKFVKWGGNVMETATAEDLGARDADSDPVDPLPITHLDDAQLPQRVETVFLNLDMDYQEGTQYATRTASDSDLHAAVSLPIVLVDAEAKAMADMLLFNAWVERDKFAFSLPRKFAYWEPTDVHNVNGHAIRITNKEEVGYTHINFEGVATRTGVFVTAPVAASPIGFVPQTTPVLNRTDFIPLDIPLVTDTDPANGWYAAIAGFMAGPWPGAGIFKSIDGGVNYDSVYSTVEGDTFGVATSVLADWTGGNVFDESHTVTVRLTPGSGDLASSNQLGVLNGANMALLGDEIIAFKTATLTAALTYELSGLLRGRRGTEWAMGSHDFDDDFVLLPCHSIEGAFAELGQERLYKAVTSGGLLASATETAFTNNGIALKCYAPCELGGGRNGSGDITLNWTRRTRIGGTWVDNVDAPLSEPFEQYTVVVFSDSTRATEVNAWAVDNAETYVYTAAAQTTDFGSPQATLYWNVAQNGVYGEGYEAEGTT